MSGEDSFRGCGSSGTSTARTSSIEGRYYGDSIERLPTLAAELVRLQVDVIVAGCPPAPEAAKRATSTIPIVMTIITTRSAAGSWPALRNRGETLRDCPSATPDCAASSFSCSRRSCPDSPAWLSSGIRHPVPRARVERAGGRGAVAEVAASRCGGADSERIRCGLLGGEEEAGRRTHLAQGLDVLRESRTARGTGSQNRLPSMYGVKEFAEAGGLIAYGPRPARQLRAERPGTSTRS